MEHPIQMDDLGNQIPSDVRNGIKNHIGSIGLSRQALSADTWFENFSLSALAELWVWLVFLFQGMLFD